MGLFLGLKNMTDSTQCQVYSKRSINKINNYRYFYFAAVAILFALDRVDIAEGYKLHIQKRNNSS